MQFQDGSSDVDVKAEHKHQNLTYCQSIYRVHSKYFESVA